MSWHKVDWTTAPEWATHWVVIELPPGNKTLALWYTPSMQFTAAPHFGYIGNPNDSRTSRPTEKANDAQ